MIENNENTEVARDVITQDMYDGLQAKLYQAEQARDFHKELHFKFASVIEQARKSIEDVLEGDINAKDTFRDFEEAFELLGVSIEREVEVEIVLTWRGTVTLPGNIDPEDLSDYDFSADLRARSYEDDLELYGFEVRERR